MKQFKYFLLFVCLLWFTGGSVVAATKPAVKANKVVAAKTTFKALSASKIKQLTESFIKQNLIDDQTKLRLSEPKDYNPGLFFLEAFLDQSTEPINLYVTKDGKLFFPQALNLNEGLKPSASGKSSTADKSTEPQLAKSKRPTVELFVMSHCPFGTQMEKALLPVVEAMGDKVNWQLKFVDYAMHGQVELQEQLLQYCLGQIYPHQLWPYLKCFLADERGSANCLGQLGINQQILNNCVAENDQRFQVTAGAKQESYPAFNIHQADNRKYKVSGSPTLVINGREINVQRNPAALLSAVCSAFTEAPAECSMVLSADVPAPGFGFSGSAAASTAVCGN